MATESVLWLAGASGLVGGFALDLALSDAAFGTVVSFGRRPSGRASDKLIERAVDFAAFDAGDAPAPRAAVCALGTTIKKAGSREAFRAVDFDAVMAFAKGARAAGAECFALVSALGADAQSMVFYNQVKGECEDALRSMGWPSLVLAQPSLLLGDRAESRPGERVAIVLSRAVAPLLKPFGGRPIEASAVAKAVIDAAKERPAGVKVLSSGEMH